MQFAKQHSVYWSLIIYVAFNLLLFINNDESGFAFRHEELKIKINYYIFSFYIFLFFILLNYSFGTFKEEDQDLKWYHYVSVIFTMLVSIFAFFLIFGWAFFMISFVDIGSSDGHLFLSMEFLFLSVSLLSLANFSDMMKWMKLKM